MNENTSNIKPLSEAEVVKALARLDSLGIIDLLPNNRIRVKVARNFTWLPDGPIQQFFRAQLKDDDAILQALHHTMEQERERGREASTGDEPGAEAKEPSRVNGRVKASPLARRIAARRGRSRSPASGPRRVPAPAARSP